MLFIMLFFKKNTFVQPWTVANHEVQVEIRSKVGLYKTDFMIQFPLFCV